MPESSFSCGKHFDKGLRFFDEHTNLFDKYMVLYDKEKGKLQFLYS